MLRLRVMSWPTVSRALGSVSFRDQIRLDPDHAESGRSGDAVAESRADAPGQ